MEAAGNPLLFLLVMARRGKNSPRDDLGHHRCKLSRCVVSAK